MKIKLVFVETDGEGFCFWCGEFITDKEDFYFVNENKTLAFCKDCFNLDLKGYPNEKI